MKKVIFMGTPEFSVPSLKELVRAGYDVSLVVTQPDKPSGRGKKLKKSAVKEAAEELKLEIFQPGRLKKPENVEVLKSHAPDFIVVVAYGQILSKEILEIPRFGCINVHASLLPKLRGAAPINWAIINGDLKSGVTTMLMDEGLDTGDMLLKHEVEIPINMNAAELHDVLMEAGGKILIQTLEGIEDGTVIPVKQEGTSTYAPMLSKEMASIDWNDSAVNVHNKIRGMYPWPSAYFMIGDKCVKVCESAYDAADTECKPGDVLEVSPEGIKVATGKGSVIIKALQMPGKSKMKIDAYLRGNKFDAKKLD